LRWHLRRRRRDEQGDKSVDHPDLGMQYGGGKLEDESWPTQGVEL
jgi:hypothetical protein